MYFVFGINHRSAGIEVRERYFTTSSILEEYYERLSFIDEVVILSTCNRFEVYGYLKVFDRFLLEDIKQKLFRIFNVFREDRKMFYFLLGKEAIFHLFKVVSGVDSRIIGETQIHDQIKKAYYYSLNSKRTRYFLNKLFHKALFVSSKIRREVSFGGKVSLGSVVKQYVSQFSPEVNILVIGTGDIVLHIIPYLKSVSKSIYVASTRYYDRALEIARKFGVDSIMFEDAKRNLKIFDVVITATNCPFHIIGDSEVNDVCDRLLIIDLGVPRNVKIEKTKKNIVIYNIDNLLEKIDENLFIRESKISDVSGIIYREVDKFMKEIKCDLMKRNIIIGSRGSNLARKQVEEFLEKLKNKVPSLKVRFITRYFDTTGDKDKYTPIYQIEGSDFFTDVIENALLNGEIDIAIHSAKDLPDIHKDDIITIALTKSEDKTDCLVLRKDLEGYTINTLPSGSVIGVSSQRRISQIKSIRPDLITKDIRGNIEERLEKLDKGEYDGVIMATIALKRLGLTERISQVLPVDVFDTHPLQGSLAIQIRKEDLKKFSFLLKIDSRQKVVFDTMDEDIEKKLVDFVNKYCWQNFVAFEKEFMSNPNKIVKVDGSIIDMLDSKNITKVENFLY